MATPTETVADPTFAARSRPEEPAEAVGPLLRGIAVLRALTEARGGQDLPSLARALGLARSSLDRVVATLAELGYVRLQGREVLLAPRLMRLGNAYLRASRIPELLGPLAERLSDEIDEIVTLTVTHGGEYLVHETSRPRRLTLTCRVGDKLPLEHCAGGALLAATWVDEDWERFRAGHACADGEPDASVCVRRQRERAADAARRGYVLDDQWLEPGLIAVSMAVRGADGAAVCNANVLSFTSRHPTAHELAETALPALKRTVASMERELRQARPEPVVPGNSVISAGGPGVLEALARGFAVVEAFTQGRPELTISDVAHATGLARATVRRALITLDYLDYVTQAGGRYRLTPAILDLGTPVLSRLTLAQIAQPHLEALSNTVGLSASLAVLHEDTEIMYVARAAQPARLTTIGIHVGTRLPAYATSLGRVLLAELPEARCAIGLNDPHLVQMTPFTVTNRDELLHRLHRARDDGYAIVDQELEIGLRSIAVPIRGHDGTTLAALNLAMHTGRDSAAEHVQAMLATADAIHRDLLATGPFSRLEAM